MAADDQKNVYYTQGLPVPETPEAGEKPSPWRKTDIIGKRRPRVDAYERLSGAAVYPSDLSLPGMLYAAVLRCPYPHARSKRLTARRRKICRACMRLSAHARRKPI